jgi:hypothetical protein
VRGDVLADHALGELLDRRRDTPGEPKPSSYSLQPTIPSSVVSLTKL